MSEGFVARRWLSSRRWDLLLALLFLLGCGLVDHWRLPRIDIDSHSYLNLAKGMLERGQFIASDEHGGFERQFVRTPLYPLLIAVPLKLLGQTGISVVAWLQRLAWAWLITCFLPPISDRAKHAFSFAVLGKAAALFTPLALITTSLILSECAFAILMITGLQLLCSASTWRGLLAAGLLLGLANLVRPVGFWIPVLAVVVIACRSRPSWPHFFRLFAAVLLSLAIPFAWVIRVHSLTGHFALTSLSGPTFALNRQHAIERLSAQQVASLSADEQAFAGNVKSLHDVYWSALLLRQKRGLDEFTANAIAGSVARFALGEDPLDWCRTVGQNFVRMFCSATEGLMLLAAASHRPDVEKTTFSQARTSDDVGVLIVHLILRGIQPLILFVGPVILVILYRREVAADLYLLVLLFCSAYLLIAPALATICYGRFLFPVLPTIALIYQLPSRAKT